MSARLNHINTVIKPALKKNKLVLTDRFCDSSFVYQCYLTKLGINYGKLLHKKMLDNFLPNKTFLFLLKPKEIVKRIKTRKIGNKYDLNNLNFHQKIIQGYKILSKNNKRFIVINAERSFDEINYELQNKIINIIN